MQYHNAAFTCKYKFFFAVICEEILKEFDHLQSNNVEMEAHVTDTFDEWEFLRQFDFLQSDNVDILAQALEHSSIPSDSNNNDQ